MGIITKLLNARNNLVLNRDLVKDLGLIETAILSELCYENDYWEEKGLLEDGFFFSTIQNIEDGLGIKRFQQDRAIAVLKGRGILSIKRKGVPAKRYFRINEKAILGIIDVNKILSNKIDKLDCMKPTISLLENNKLDCRFPTSKYKGISINKLSINKEEEIYKEEESSHKKKSVRNKLPVYPTLEEVKDYCLNVRKNSVDYKRFFDYYDVNDWKDKDGKPLKNWKQKIIAVWEPKNNNNSSKPQKDEIVIPDCIKDKSLLDMNAEELKLYYSIFKYD